MASGTAMIALLAAFLGVSAGDLPGATWHLAKGVGQSCGEVCDDFGLDRECVEGQWPTSQEEMEQIMASDSVRQPCSRYRPGDDAGDPSWYPPESDIQGCFWLAPGMNELAHCGDKYDGAGAEYRLCPCTTRCACGNGTAVEPEDCPEDNVTMCASCHRYFHMIDGLCTVRRSIHSQAVAEIVGILLAVANMVVLAAAALPTAAGPAEGPAAAEGGGAEGAPGGQPGGDGARRFLAGFAHEGALQNLSAGEVADLRRHREFHAKTAVPGAAARRPGGAAEIGPGEGLPRPLLGPY